MGRGQVLIACVSAFAAGGLLMWGILGNSGDGTPPGANPTTDEATGASPLATPSGGQSPEPSQGPTEPASTAAPAECPKATVTVSTADELTSALRNPRPGDVIVMASGTYEGLFSTRASGSKGEPITLCGAADAVIDGGGLDGGYGFHLDGAKYWVLQGFTVTNAQKGVMADGTVGSVIEGLTVHHLGDEGIHLRDFSTDNTVRGNTIFDTGNRRKKFGEGIYIGTANSNWCTVSDCKEDHSDRNVVEKNRIYGTTAENVDIKEGTSKGILRGNSFDGGALTKSGGDSWVDVKGNDWLIEDNKGKDSIEDGFQVHDVVDGWGKRNVFRDNVAAVNGPGFGFAIRSKGANVVECSNSATNAKEGLSNVPCS